MFDSVLVANRGEIAVRIIRTLKRLGIRSVGVYSDADAGAPHVRAADIAVRIGTAAASDSYLRVDRVVEAALASGSAAIHPGYGFLAENPALVDAAVAAGVVFVGPPRAAIEAMGDKIQAKATVARAGVRVVPGSVASGLVDDELVDAAREAGFPVLIKPSAGGGGKGMHVVREESEMRDALASARREARSAFGDDNLLVERFIERPRHIEIQVLADMHGNVVHLGERECSLQRRHQKIVEEAPSPYLTDEQRAAMGAQAVAAARACGYVNAGTVELIVSGVDANDAFFMEMNTRLQVEHPVTEMVWGLDLVEWQLRVAAGERLPFTQGDLRPNGHAVEARVYAEDPGHGFLPTGGRVLLLREPVGEGVRVDSGLAAGVEVGAAYDPMLAKVVAWAPDRDAALRRLDTALAETTILGVTTNVEFLRALLAHPDVRSGELDTGLVERDLQRLTAHPRHTEVSLVAAAALAELVPTVPPADPWATRTGWRSGAETVMTWTADDSRVQPPSVRLRWLGNAWELREPGREPVAVTASWRGDDLDVGIDGTATRVAMTREGRDVWVGAAGATRMYCEPEPVRSASDARAASATGAVTSPMPGTVVAVAVAEGDEVTAGRALVVVEAMKMEHTVVAPSDGVVTDLPVTVGQKVALGQLLARVGAGAGATEQRATEQRGGAA